MKNVIIIPSRMESSRLPGKPLAEIEGLPMIVHVYHRALEADCGEVIVAAGDKEICEVIKKHGGEAILTKSSHPSGSDRIHEALNIFDPEKNYENIINLQGDLPNIKKDAIKKILLLLYSDESTDISTLGANIGPNDIDNPNVVKAIVRDYKRSKKVDDFVRTIDDKKNGGIYHHIGVYGYRRQSLERFVNLKQSIREKKKKLEQLRALDNDMVISIELIDNIPVGVDTEEDLNLIRKKMGE